jgi:putative hydrolase of HD superfamily
LHERERLSPVTQIVFDALAQRDSGSSLQQIVDFILEIDKLKGVTRKIRPRGLDRYENSAEHSWQLALLAASLAHYAVTPVNLDRVMRMLLIHDLGEIDTGDTIFYAEDGLQERKAAERAAVERMFGLLAERQRAEFLALWLEFEDNHTAESRFAHALDRAMPLLMNLNNDGQSWRENGISYDRVINRVGPPIERGCPALWEFLAARLQKERERGWFGMA